MRLAERKEMLKSLREAEAACCGEDALRDLMCDIGRAADYLTLLVAGERKCETFVAEVAKSGSFHGMPLKRRLALAEKLVREVYGKFEEVLAANFDNALTYGERMVLGAVGDAVWCVAGLWDDMLAEERACEKENADDKKTA